MGATESLGFARKDVRVVSIGADKFGPPKGQPVTITIEWLRRLKKCVEPVLASDRRLRSLNRLIGDPAKVVTC